MRVLIVGATGSIGRLLLEQLLALPSPPTLRISTRDPSKTTFPPSVEVIQGDVSDASSWPRMFHAVDRVFLYSVSGRASPELMKALKAGGVSRVVLLSGKSVVTEPDSPFAQMPAPWEAAVRAAGLSYTFIRPTMFNTNYQRHWRAEVRATGGLALPYPDSHSAPVAAEDVAAVAVVALTTDQLLDAAPNLTGPQSMTQSEQLEALNRVRAAAGVPLIRVRKVSPEEWKVHAAEHMPAVLCDALLSTWKGGVGHPEAVESSERITGRPATSYDAWADKYSADICQ